MANIVKNAVGMYRTPLIEVSDQARDDQHHAGQRLCGAGRPEANYFMERLIEAAARETGIDSLDLRRRNFVAGSEMPFAAASGMNYDSGDFAGVLDAPIEAADWSGFPARRGRKRGARPAARSGRRLLPGGHGTAQQGNGRNSV